MTPEQVIADALSKGVDSAGIIAALTAAGYVIVRTYGLGR